MNRGYTAYLKESKAAVKQAFEGKGSYIKYYVWLIMLLLGKLFILPGPAMDLSVVKQSKNVLENKKITIFNSFENTFKSKSFWSLFSSRMLYAFFLIGGLVVICLLAVLYFSFCYWALFSLQLESSVYLLIVLIIPVCVILICYIISVVFRASPMAYVAYTDNETQPSSILAKSFKSMNQGKFIIFLNVLRVIWFNLLFSLLICFVIFVFEYLVTTFLFTSGGIFGMVFADLICELNSAINLDLSLAISSDVYDILYAILLICEMALSISLCILLLKLNARLSLIHSVSCYALFEDLVDDKFNQNKIAVGVFVKSSKNKKIKDTSLKDVFESSSSVECEVASPVVEKRVMQDLTDKITLDEELNLSFENNTSEVTEWVF